MISCLAMPLGDTIVYKNKELKLKLSFDRVLRVYALWRDELFSEAEKLDLALEILVVNLFCVRKMTTAEKGELLTGIFKGFILGDQQETQDEPDEKIVDFEQDAHYIYASFYQDYGIDLLRMQGDLHWWKFSALFAGLSDTTKIRQVMAIRARPLPKPTKYNQDEIQQLIKLKNHYRLKLSQEEQNKQFQRSLDKLAETLYRRAQQS